MIYEIWDKNGYESGPFVSRFIDEEEMFYWLKMQKGHISKYCEVIGTVYTDAPVGQLVESPVLETVQCQFESDQGYQEQSRDRGDSSSSVS